MKFNKKGFSIIEILVGIFIFSVGLVSIYFLIVSTMRLNEYSKNSIVASNLARESIELIRNVRDSNYVNMYKWNKMPGNDFNSFFQTGVYYKVETDLGATTTNVKFEEIIDFGEGKSEINSKMKNYRLCLNADNIYTYDCNSLNKETYFYRYVKFDDVKHKGNTGNTEIIPDALKLTTKVVWYARGYHEIEFNTILTDFQKQ